VSDFDSWNLVRVFSMLVLDTWHLNQSCANKIRREKKVTYLSTLLKALMITEKKIKKHLTTNHSCTLLEKALFQK
jgi:hypothetical protein